MLRAEAQALGLLATSVWDYKPQFEVTYLLPVPHLQLLYLVPPQAQSGRLEAKRREAQGTRARTGRPPACGLAPTPVSAGLAGGGRALPNLCAGTASGVQRDLFFLRRPLLRLPHPVPVAGLAALRPPLGREGWGCRAPQGGCPASSEWRQRPPIKCLLGFCNVCLSYLCAEVRPPGQRGRGPGEGTGQGSAGARGRWRHTCGFATRRGAGTGRRRAVDSLSQGRVQARPGLSHAGAVGMGLGDRRGPLPPCEAGADPCSVRSPVCVPRLVEEARDIPPSWPSAGGDPSPSFLSSDVSPDLAEGARGHDGDGKGRRGSPASVPSAGHAHALIWPPPKRSPGGSS